MSAPRVAIIGVLVATMGLLALFGYRLASPGSGSSLEGAGRVNNVGRMGKMEPRAAEDFSLKSFDGETIQLSDLRGKVVVLNFWSSWCVACKKEAPVFQRVWQSHQDKDVVILGVNIWDKEEQATGFLAEQGITYPNGTPEGNLAAEYGLTGIPETFVIDTEGMIVRRWLGPMTDAELSALIAAGRPGSTATDQ